MANKTIYTVKESTLTGIADSVREINKTEGKLSLAQIKEELDKVPERLENVGGEAEALELLKDYFNEAKFYAYSNEFTEFNAPLTSNDIQMDFTNASNYPDSIKLIFTAKKRRRLLL